MSNSGNSTRGENSTAGVATLTIGDDKIELPVLVDSFGHRFVDIQR